MLNILACSHHACQANWPMVKPHCWGLVYKVSCIFSSDISCLFNQESVERKWLVFILCLSCFICILPICVCWFNRSTHGSYKLINYNEWLFFSCLLLRKPLNSPTQRKEEGLTAVVENSLNFTPLCGTMGQTSLLWLLCKYNMYCLNLNNYIYSVSAELEKQGVTEHHEENRQDRGIYRGWNTTNLLTDTMEKLILCSV